MWFGAFNDSDNHDLHMTISICFEIIFVFLMIKKFLTTYVNQGETKPVKNLTLISMKYLKGDFLSDLIPLLPLTFIFDKDTKMVKLLYIVKVIRVLNGFKVFDTHKIYQNLHYRF